MAELYSTLPRHRKGYIPQDLLPISVISGYAVSGMHAEAVVMPAHELFDGLAVYLAPPFSIARIVV